MSRGGENNVHTLLADFFDNSEMDAGTSYLGAASPDNIFSILEALESSEFDPLTSLDHETSNLDPKEGKAEAEAEAEGKGEGAKRIVSQKSISSLSSSAPVEESKTELEAAAANGSSPKIKRQKVSTGATGEEDDGLQIMKISHITVERNRRKQMNDNLVVLRSLMPSFYVKRGDQASIVGGVVEYISELQQVLQSLEAKKQRKVYSEVLSPRKVVVSSPRLTSSTLSPRKPPPSPRPVPATISLPISPRTPTPTSPYKHHRMHQLLSPTMPAAAAASLEPSPSSSPSIDHTNELAANSKSAIADVEVKFSGPNVLLKTTSPRIPGQAVKIMSTLEEHLSLEILDVSLNTIDQTMLNSFTIKIGIECQLSAEELAHQIQQTFC